MLVRLPRPRLPLLGGAGNAYIRKVLGTEPQDLLCYWTMGDKSGVIADNIVGDPGFDAAYTGVTLGAPGIGDGGTCPWYDGANDTMNVYTTALRDGFDGNEGSLMFWFRVNAAGVWSDSTIRYLAWLSCGPSNDDDWLVTYKDSTAGRFKMFFAAGVGYKLVQIDGLSSTAWICAHQTWTDSGDAYKAYLNGVQQGSTLTGFGPWTQQLSETRCKVGSAGTGAPTGVWHGWMAHVAIWTKCLTQPQVVALATV